MEIKAFAKINLTLDIVGKKRDGYHLIDSVFQSVGLFDTVIIEKDNNISVICGGIREDKNTAFIAAKEFFSFTGIHGGAKIEIEKGIPLLSGLGGGSADAAAVIIALDKMYNTNLSRGDLNKIALSCGADVPFCLYGGTARVGGIGEKITKLADIKGFWTVIVKSGEKLSTADMYKRIDNMTDLSFSTEKFVSLLNSGRNFDAVGCIDNAFCSASDKETVFDALKCEKPLGVSLSGSGPSCFAVFPDENSALSACENLKKQGFKPYCVPFLNRGNLIVE